MISQAYGTGFIALCCGSVRGVFPMFFRDNSLAFGQPYDCLSAREVTLRNLGNYTASNFKGCSISISILAVTTVITSCSLASFLFNSGHKWHHINICHYLDNTVGRVITRSKYDMILHKALQWPKHNIDQSVNSRKITHTSPSWTN